MNILQSRIFVINWNKLTWKVTDITHEIDRQTKIYRDTGSYA